MTSQQIALVQTSFQSVQPILDAAAGLFYDRLFDLDPTLRPLFRTPHEQQSRMLAQALTIVVKSLDRPEAIKPAVEALGRRHTGYGVRDEHYATVGAALLWTLEQGLGPAFTPAVRDAWSAAYGWIASTMQQAAASRSTETTSPHAFATAHA
jgi:hemoglobin-like flavoprotein